jgi:hypothetical protein
MSVTQHSAFAIIDRFVNHTNKAKLPVMNSRLLSIPFELDFVNRIYYLVSGALTPFGYSERSFAEGSHRNRITWRGNLQSSLCTLFIILILTAVQRFGEGVQDILKDCHLFL